MQNWAIKPVSYYDDQSTLLYTIVATADGEYGTRDDNNGYRPSAACVIIAVASRLLQLCC